MLLLNPPFISREMIVDAAALTALYPIGLTLEQFSLLFYQTHSLDISVFSESINLVPDLTSTILIIETENSSFAGNATRRISFVGALNDNGTELSSAQRPKTASDYPTFVGGNGQVIIIIDFGKTLYYGGLYYPQIQITFSNGLSSDGYGRVVGGISLGDFGFISIYNNQNLDGIALGHINIGESYLDLYPTTHLAPAQTTFTLRSVESDGNSFFNTINRISIGGKQCGFSARRLEESLYELDITTPSFGGRKKVLFEFDSPYNYFWSNFEISN